MYAYGGNDPVNKIDPSGTAGTIVVTAGDTFGAMLAKAILNVGVATTDSASQFQLPTVVGDPIIVTHKRLSSAALLLLESEGDRLTAKCNALGPRSGDAECDAIPDVNWQLPVGTYCAPGHSCSRGRPHLVPDLSPSCSSLSKAQTIGNVVGGAGAVVSAIPHPAAKGAGKVLAVVGGATKGAAGTISLAKGCK